MSRSAPRRSEPEEEEGGKQSSALDSMDSEACGHEEGGGMTDRQTDGDAQDRDLVAAGPQFHASAESQLRALDAPINSA